MISRSVSNIVKYVLFLGLAAGLLVLTFKEVSFSQLLENLQKTNYSWLLISIFIAVMSHVARAYRWIILMEPLGYKPPLSNTFFAVMVGYLANLVVPRMGEVTRCGILRKTDMIPADSSFGTVITERLFDLMTLILLIFINLLIEQDLKSFFLDYIQQKLAGVEHAGLIFLIFGILVMAGGIAVYLMRNRIRQSNVYQKLSKTLSGLLQGIFSFRKIRRKVAFFASTFVIWFLYWAMVQVAIKSYPETAHLGFVESFTLLIVGGMAMSAPVQGGIGAYHLMVGSVLTIYGLNYESGVSAATILHSSQMIMIVAVGSLSLLAAIFIGNRFKRQSNEHSEKD